MAIRRCAVLYPIDRMSHALDARDNAFAHIGCVLDNEHSHAGSGSGSSVRRSTTIAHRGAVDRFMKGSSR
jgi:hypothetical protein